MSLDNLAVLTVDTDSSRSSGKSSDMEAICEQDRDRCCMYSFARPQ